jgi:hypothetical protein
MQNLRSARGFEPRHLPHAPSMPSALQPYRLHPNWPHRSPPLVTCDFRRSSSDRSCSTRAEAANSAPPPPAAAARSSAISKFAAAANAPISAIECTGHEAGRGVRSAVGSTKRGMGRRAGLGMGRCERSTLRPDRAVPLRPLPEGASASASTSERDVHACGRYGIAGDMPRPPERQPRLCSGGTHRPPHAVCARTPPARRSAAHAVGASP